MFRTTTTLPDQVFKGSPPTIPAMLARGNPEQVRHDQGGESGGVSDRGGLHHSAGKNSQAFSGTQHMRS